ncbi:MAG: hypothetical protein ACO1RX_21920 [Candidatus Sericytochromatia bacterium]
MNLTELAGLQNKLQAGQNGRSQRADQFCAAGVLALQNAYAQNFADKSLLKQAHGHFINAIRYNRQDIAAYLGLAYLLMLVEDVAMARKYLQEALRVEPDNAEALQLLAYMTRLESGPAVSVPADVALPEWESPAETLDYDALYEQIEGFIFKQVHQLMSRPAMPRPTLDAETLQSLRQDFAALQSQHAYVNQHLQTLEQELDTSELVQKMRPFESLLRRFEQALHISEQLERVMQALERELQAVQALQVQAHALQTPAELAELEDLLEETMDRCDALADQLDAFENQADDLSAALQRYEALITRVEALRESLDHFAEHVGQTPALAV